MPFITEDHRVQPDASIPGDRCYIEYKKMIDLWRANPRWTTVDKMLEEWMVDEQERAFFLAFLVFFVKYAMPYEDIKEAENGRI